MEILDKNNVTGIAALLVHAAKIDEKYSNKEKNLIKDFIQSYLKDEDKENILINAEEIEKNSNQLLNYTNIIKKNTEEVKDEPNKEGLRFFAITIFYLFSLFSALLIDNLILL